MMNWQPPPPPVTCPPTTNSASAGYSCTTCGKTYTTSFALSRHTKSLHEGLRYSCNINGCNKNFSGKSNLEVHMRIHSGERPYSCHCGKLFRSKDHLNRHTKTHASKDGDNSNKPTCQLCSKKFSRNESLKRHLQAVHKQTPNPDQKPFKCSFCGKVFSLLYHYQEHLKTHPGQHPLTTYSISFPSANSNLVTITATTATSNGEVVGGGRGGVPKTSGKQKKIVAQCHICNKTFSRKESVKRHLQVVHDGEKPHKCHCGKAFTQKHHLQQHNKIHSEPHSHICHLCNERFAELQGLRSHHVQSHHTPELKSDAKVEPTMVESLTWCQLR